ASAAAPRAPARRARPTAGRDRKPRAIRASAPPASAPPPALSGSRPRPPQRHPRPPPTLDYLRGGVSLPQRSVRRFPRLVPPLRAARQGPSISATGGQRLSQQDQMIGALKPGTSCAISRQRLTDLVHGLAVRFLHRARRSLHNATDRDDHGEPELLCRGDCFGRAFRDEWPLAPVGMEGAVPIEVAGVGIPVLDALEDCKGGVSEP